MLSRHLSRRLELYIGYPMCSHPLTRCPLPDATSTSTKLIPNHDFPLGEIPDSSNATRFMNKISKQNSRVRVSHALNVSLLSLRVQRACHQPSPRPRLKEPIESAQCLGLVSGNWNGQNGQNGPTWVSSFYRGFSLIDRGIGQSGLLEREAPMAPRAWDVVAACDVGVYRDNEAAG